MDLLCHSKLLLEHPPNCSPGARGKSPTPSEQHIRLRWHLHRNYQAVLGTGSEGNTGSSYPVMWCDTSRIGDMSFNILKQVFEERAASSIPTEGVFLFASLLACCQYQESLLSEWLLQTIKTIGHFGSSKKGSLPNRTLPGKKSFILCPDGPPAKLISFGLSDETLHVVISQCTGSKDFSISLKDVLSTFIKSATSEESGPSITPFAESLSGNGNRIKENAPHWLSKDKCFIQTNNEVLLLSSERKEEHFWQCFEQKNFILELAYLDIFNHMKETSLRSQSHHL